MSTATTLGAYGLALAVVFGGAVAVGSAVGPVGVAEAEPAHGSDPAGPHGSTGGSPHSDD